MMVERKQYTRRETRFVTRSSQCLMACVPPLPHQAVVLSLHHDCCISTSFCSLYQSQTVLSGVITELCIHIDRGVAHSMHISAAVSPTIASLVSRGIIIEKSTGLSCIDTSIVRVQYSRQMGEEMTEVQAYGHGHDTDRHLVDQRGKAFFRNVSLLS